MKLLKIFFFLMLSVMELSYRVLNFNRLNVLLATSLFNIFLRFYFDKGANNLLTNLTKILKNPTLTITKNNTWIGRYKSSYFLFFIFFCPIISHYPSMVGTLLFHSLCMSWPIFNHHCHSTVGCCIFRPANGSKYTTVG